MSCGGRNRTYAVLVQSQVPLPTATTPQHVTVKRAPSARLGRREGERPPWILLASGPPSDGQKKTGAGTIAAKGSSDPRRGERISRVHVWPVSAGVDDRRRNRADRQQQNAMLAGKGFRGPVAWCTRQQGVGSPLLALRRLSLWSSRARAIAAHWFHSGSAALPPVHRTPGGVTGSGRLRRLLPPEKPLCAGPFARSALPAGSGTRPASRRGYVLTGGDVQPSPDIVTPSGMRYSFLGLPWHGSPGDYPGSPVRSARRRERPAAGNLFPALPERRPWALNSPGWN